MNQTVNPKKAASAERCLECEENETWIYSYEEVLNKLAEESHRAIQSYYSPTLKGSSSHLHYPNVKYHNLKVDEYEVEIMLHEQLYDLKILKGTKEARIILWGIKPAEAVNLVNQLISKLENFNN